MLWYESLHESQELHLKTQLDHILFCIVKELISVISNDSLLSVCYFCSSLSQLFPFFSCKSCLFVPVWRHVLPQVHVLVHSPRHRTHVGPVGMLSKTGVLLVLMNVAAMPRNACQDYVKIAYVIQCNVQSQLGILCNLSLILKGSFIILLQRA